MISKNLKNTLLGTGIAMALTFGAYTSVNSYNNIVQVNADELRGDVKITISSLWTYGSPNWSDKKTVVFKGDRFKVKEMINVSGSNMYRLENGLYVSANTKYVSFVKEESNSNISGNIPNNTGDKSYNTIANLNLRSGSSTSNKILLTIPKGQEVKMISQNGSWSKVSYKGKEGYVSNKYLKFNSTVDAKPENPKPEKPSPQPGKPSETVKNFKTSENLNLRQGSGTNYKIILTIPKGKDVIEISREGFWSKVSYNGKIGYSSNKYLKFNSTANPKPENPKPEKPSSQPEKPSEGLKNFKTVENLNLREGSGTNHKIILTIPKGKDIIEISREGSWSKVSYNGKIGHVSNKYLLEIKVENPKPVEPEKPKPTEDEEKEDLPVVLNVENMQTLYEKEDIKLIGHSVSNVGIKDIQVTLNGKVIKVDRVERNDLEKLYQNYKDLNNIGFEVNIGKANLLNGKNTLNIKSILNDNTSKNNMYSFSVINDSRFKIENYNNKLDFYVAKEKQTIPNFNGGSASILNIKKYMDPANFVHDEVYKYMFLELSYKENDLNINAEKLNVILNGKGVLENKGQSFLNAANKSGINPFYLIAHALLETGNGKSVLANGQTINDTYETFGDESTVVEDSVSEENEDKLYYNMFGINAFNRNPNLWGGQRAYLEDWDSIEKAIEGGAYWIGRDYINRPGNPQNTLYKMRFNVANNMSHEYARDVMWAYKQAKNIKVQFDEMGVDSKLNFIVPIFKQ